MARKKIRHSPLNVCSLEELLRHEAEITKRINATPNGGRLLLLDPQRLIRDLQIELTPDALEAWRSAYPDFFARPDSGRVYDAIAQSQPHDEVKITVKGLFPRRRV